MQRLGMLEISFYGPFFYDLRPQTLAKEHVAIYAPKCPGHKAGIFSAKAEKPLRGRVKSGDKLIYKIGGPVFMKEHEKRPPKYTNKDLKVLNVSQDIKPSYETASFSLYLPVPQFVYAINPSASVEVVKSKKTPIGEQAKYATGLRFYYEADLSKMIFASVPKHSNFFESDFDEAYQPVGVQRHPMDNADVYIRYAGTTPEDPDHDDAANCFGLIAGLCGLDWWLCYEDWTGGTVDVRGGDDCRAPVMVAT